MAEDVKDKKKIEIHWCKEFEKIWKIHHYRHRLETLRTLSRACSFLMRHRNHATAHKTLSSIFFSEDQQSEDCKQYIDSDEICN
uniref:Uncharacterized protein n=1 Tax=Caenorhabditis japonica TaxID=281687 RepID=A0A8R1EEU4_CAEJA